MISSLENYSVHGIVNGSSLSDRSNGDTIMLSIYSASLDRTKFIIVDLKLNRYLCALENDYQGLIETTRVHSAWSMDRTQVILRVPTLDGSTALDFYKGMLCFLHDFPYHASSFQWLKRKRGSTGALLQLITMLNFNSIPTIGHLV